MSQQRPPRQPLVSPGAIDCHVADLTACFSADVTLAAAQGALASHDQFLPVDGDPEATLGRLVSINSTGPLRLGYGAWRDLLLGAQFLNGRGELISAGGRTVKNVAGYDLTKFAVGQGDVCARVVTLTTRTYKRPAGALLARFAPDADVLQSLVPSVLRPQWSLLTREALLCGYLGDERSLDFWMERLPARSPIDITRRSLADDIAHRAALWRAGSESLARIAIPPAKLNEFAKSLGDQTWAADANFGIVMVSGDLDIARLKSLVTEAGGYLTFIEADGSVRAPAFGVNEQQILSRLKHAFDPDGALRDIQYV